MGVPPTGKQITVSATLVERFKDGKLVEHKSLFDTLGMMQQLGLVPLPQPGCRTSPLCALCSKSICVSSRQLFPGKFDLSIPSYSS